MSYLNRKQYYFCIYRKYYLPINNIYLIYTFFNKMAIFNVSNINNCYMLDLYKNNNINRKIVFYTAENFISSEIKYF